MFFRATIATALMLLVSGGAALSQPGPHGPNRQQMIENENARMKAAKARADAAKAAELEADQKRTGQGQPAGTAPAEPKRSPRS